MMNSLTGSEWKTVSILEARPDNGKGRPKFLIPLRQLVDLRSLNFTWKAIAEMLGVSQKTVLRRRH